MNRLLAKAINELHALDALPDEEQDRIAARVLEEVAAAQRASGGKEEEATPIWKRIAERAESVPNDVWETLPEDGAAELDHYLYGTPKRNT